MKKRIFFYLFIFLIPGFTIIFAQNEITVSPTIIDQKAKAREILEFSVRVTNYSNSKVDLYPIVNDISIKEGKQKFLDPSLLDKSTSLARWIRISRGVIELGPGQEKEIPFSVQVNLNAQPGKYYALITFSQGSTRAEAESRAKKLNLPQVMLNIEVEEHVIEKAQIQKFQTEKKIFLGPPIKFLLEIENIGNRKIKPQGQITIYNRRGEEVGSIDINQNQASILPAASGLFQNVWHKKNSLGQYKAVLVAEYGNKQKRDLQDTIYFWVFPWQYLLAVGGGLLVLIIISLWLIFKKFKSYYSLKSFSDKIIDLRYPK